MYYPKQIPYLLNEKFKKNIEYKEYHYKELKDYCMCLWEMKSKKEIQDPIWNYILPDACIDIVIDFQKCTICFSGFSKETEPYPVSGWVDFLGVRLKPGAFRTIFSKNAEEIMDHNIPFQVIEKEYNLEEIFSKNDPERRVFLKRYLLEKIKNKPNRDFLFIVEELYQNPKEQKVKKITEKFGYEKRHVYRIFKENYGVSPKVLLNILRLHLCLTLLLEKKMQWMDIVYLCGFYDQSHFIKEIKRYTNSSPLKIFKN